MTPDLVKPRAMAALASMMGPRSSGMERPMWDTYEKLAFLGVRETHPPFDGSFSTHVLSHQRR